MSTIALENIFRSTIITCVWIILLFLAHSPGRKTLRLLKVENINQLERTILALSIGFGFIAVGFFLLGLIGFLQPIYMFFWIFALAIWSREDLLESIMKVKGVISAVRNTWTGGNYQGKALIIIAAVLLILAFMQSLTPTWDEDGLMYHMEAPRRFLEAGRIIFILETYQSNFPMFSELLFAIGIALQIDPLAKLIHLTFGILLILATYSMGERYLGVRKGWLPAAILLGIPMVVLLASINYILGKCFGCWWFNRSRLRRLYAIFGIV